MLYLKEIEETHVGSFAPEFAHLVAEEKEICYRRIEQMRLVLR